MDISVKQIPKISIVIPVYNGIKYGLSRCLSSIWSQDVATEQYEVICVDDCSTDDTIDWLKIQQESHSNLRVIRHDVNKRQGGARNTGIRAAEGKFIMFVDQDDYYDCDAFPKVFAAIEAYNVDLLIVDATYERPGEYNQKLQHNFPHRHVMTGDDQIRYNSIPWAPWKFIFQRRLVIENNLFFDENERIEDIDWVHRLTHYAESAIYQPILLIHYQKSDVSTTMTSFKSKETMYSTLRCGIRMCRQRDSVFKDSHDDVRSGISRVGHFVCYLGVRNYMFCRDSFKIKKQHLIELRPYVDKTHTNTLISFATRYTNLFVCLSNISSYIAPTILKLHRKWKYRKGTPTFSD